MPFVSGFLRIRKKGHPDQGLPPGEGETDPDYGVEVPGAPDIGLPEPPPGIWPPLTPDNPWRPLPEHPIAPTPGHPIAPGGGGEHPEHPIVLPPGTVWPPLPEGVHGKYLALVLIGGGGHGAHYRYVVIDADAYPDQGLPPHPDQGLPNPPTAQPRRN